jgi:hypothetical protein
MEQSQTYPKDRATTPPPKNKSALIGETETTNDDFRSCNPKSTKRKIQSTHTLKKIFPLNSNTIHTIKEITVFPPAFDYLI